MIHIAGSAHRTFIFPAQLPAAFAYYTDIPESLHFLAHISVAQNLAARQYRLLYSSLESGLYRVRIFCDVQAVVEADHCRIQIKPVEGKTPARAQAGLYSMTGYGFYRSEIHFSPYGEQTQIEYEIDMQARLPKPLVLRWVPEGLMDSIAHHRFVLHTDEIIDGFIQHSVLAFQARQE